MQKPLSQVSLNTSVQICGFDNEPSLNQRLINLGLFPGALIKPIHMNKTGIILARGFDRIALANTIADKINVVSV